MSQNENSFTLTLFSMVSGKLENLEMEMVLPYSCATEPNWAEVPIRTSGVWDVGGEFTAHRPSHLDQSRDN